MLIRINEITIEEELVWTIAFSYDPKLVTLLKDTICFRYWNKGRKVWIVERNVISQGDIAAFIQLAEKLSHKVVDRRTKESFDFTRNYRKKKAPPPPPPPPPPLKGADTWADTLFRAVGPDREEVVFKALTKILHPDVKTGDEKLMKQLNQARDSRRR